MRQPLVTIVTPSYNQGGFIRATIESVLGQDYPKIEYIIMDGGSTDETAAVAAEYAGRLTWISEKDRGQAHAINKGFRMARGEIVAWLNSDDILLPGAVTRAVESFERVPDVAAIYGEGYLLDREGRVTRRFPATEPFNLWKLVYLSDYVLQQSVFFRRAAVEEIGWLDETLHYTLDWDLLIRLAKRFGLQYVPEYFGALREYPDAKSFSGGGRRVEEIRRVLERHTGLKRAPGFWIYGLETWQRQWMGDAESYRSAWLRIPVRALKFPVYAAAMVTVMLVLRYAQGICPDGWASRRMKWMLPEGRGDVLLRGIVPDDQRLRGQRLAVTVAGREWASWQVGPGDFEVRFSPPVDRPGPLLFEVRAERYTWRRCGRGPTWQRAAFIFKSASWAEPAG